MIMLPEDVSKEEKKDSTTNEANQYEIPTTSIPQQPTINDVPNPIEPSQPNLKKILLGGLYGRNGTVLRRHFEQFGKIIEIQIIRHGDGKPRGFGFITFASVDAVERAVVEKHIINDKQIDVKNAIPKGNRQQRWNHPNGFSAMNTAFDIPSTSLPVHQQNSYETSGSGAGGSELKRKRGDGDNRRTSYPRPSASVGGINLFFSKN